MTFLAEAKLSFTVIRQNMYAITDSSNESLLLYIASIFNDIVSMIYFMCLRL